MVNFGTTDCKWDKVIDMNTLFDEFRRVLTHNGTIVMTVAFPFAIDILAANKDIFKYDAVWVKNRKTNFANAKNKLMRQHENILIFSKGTTANGSKNKMVYNPQGVTPCNKIKVCGANKGHIGLGENYEGNTYIQRFTNYPSTLINQNGKRYTKHSTEKPVELFEYLIRTYSNENNIVLDCFAGSGTTGVAAKNCNRNCILIEQDPAYCEVIRKRLVAA